MENEVQSMNEAELDVLRNTKIDLEEKLYKQTQGIIFRSRSRWYAEGKQNTKYFYNLEKTDTTAKCVQVFMMKKEYS